jgi:hypothetical protein
MENRIINYLTSDYIVHSHQVLLLNTFEYLNEELTIPDGQLSSLKEENNDYASLV